MTEKKRPTRLDRRIPCGRLIDLCGKIPEGHDSISKTLNGAPCLRVGQVWVERTNDRLWKIQEVVRYGNKAEKKRMVTLVPYDGGDQSVRIKEEWLYRTMFIWDEAIFVKWRFLEEYWGQFERGEWDARQFPNFPTLAACFGFDPNSGCRVD